MITTRGGMAGLVKMLASSAISAILNKVNAVRDFGDGELSVGGRLAKGEIPEVKLQAHKGSKAAD